MFEEEQSAESQLLKNNMKEITKTLEDLKEPKMIFKSVEAFSTAIHPLFKTIHEVYSKAKLVGFLIILGGFLAVVLTFIAITPFTNAAAEEINALATLAGLLIVSGCILYGFLAHLEYKTSQNSQEAFMKSLEIIEKSNEIKLNTLREQVQTEKGFLDDVS